MVRPPTPERSAMLRYPAPDPADGSPLSRRAWLTTTTGALVAAGLVKTQVDAIDLSAQQLPGAGQTRMIGRYVSELGTRSRFEAPRRLVQAVSPASLSLTPITSLHGI